jgi:hypothetical protein
MMFCLHNIFHLVLAILPFLDYCCAKLNNQPTRMLGKYGKMLPSQTNTVFWVYYWQEYYDSRLLPRRSAVFFASGKWNLNGNFFE